MALHFLVLGPPEIRTAAGRALLPDPRSSTLFTALAVNANTPVPLDRLADALWQEPPTYAEWQVRTEVSALRRVISAVNGPADPPSIIWRRNGYLLAAEQDDELDLDRFTLLLRQGRAALDAEDHYAAAYLLGQALTYWRGPAGAGCEPFGWLDARLGDIDALRWSAAEGRLLALLHQGRTTQAAKEARALLSARPRHEPWWARHIAGLPAAGIDARHPTDAMAARLRRARLRCTSGEMHAG